MKYYASKSNFKRKQALVCARLVACHSVLSCGMATRYRVLLHQSRFICSYPWRDASHRLDELHDPYRSAFVRHDFGIFSFAIKDGCNGLFQTSFYPNLDSFHCLVRDLCRLLYDFKRWYKIQTGWVESPLVYTILSLPLELPITIIAPSYSGVFVFIPK